MMIVAKILISLLLTAVALTVRFYLFAFASIAVFVFTFASPFDIPSAVAEQLKGTKQEI